MLIKQIQNMLFVQTQEPNLIATINGVYIDNPTDATTNKTLILSELLKPQPLIKVH